MRVLLMASNPYYVKGGDDFGRQLSGISNIVSGVREQKRGQAGKAALQEAYKTRDPEAINRVLVDHPELQEQVSKMDELGRMMRKDNILSIALGADQALNIQDPFERQAFLADRKNEVEARGGNASETDFLIGLPHEEQTQALEGLVEVGRNFAGYGGGSGAGLGTDARFFGDLTKDLSDEDRDIARRVKLGLSPRAGTVTGTERIVEDDDLANKVIDFEGDKSGSKEKAKLTQQLEIGPMIAEAKAKAGVVGKDRGEDIVKLDFLDANMPNIETTVEKLNELNKIATYTTGGLMVDAGFRQMGWKVPEGATARAQAKSLIDTTILPLLKPTFGAAFTENEGNKLLDTWGDQNASPEEKEMALQGMMMSVRLQGETLRRKLDKKKTKAGDAKENQASDNIGTLSDEDLFK